ncbi:MAG: YceI family protein [Candidatus Dormibacteria bacterium]
MGAWIFDPLHTQVEFSAKHLGMMTVRGHFAEVVAGGDINVEDPTRSQIEVTVQTASIRTHDAQRDKDLRASYFLEVEKYPTMTFKSTGVEVTANDRYSLTGDLTIKGTTRPITLAVVKYGEFTDPNMGHRIGYSAEGAINRKDFGMTFEMMLDNKFVVSNEVRIQIEGELLEEGSMPAPAG